MPTQGAGPTQSGDLIDALADFYDAEMQTAVEWEAEMQAAAEWVCTQTRNLKSVAHTNKSRRSGRGRIFRAVLPFGVSLGNSVCGARGVGRLLQGSLWRLARPGSGVPLCQNKGGALTAK